MLDYVRRREEAERTAARSASCNAARRAHEELADRYAELLRTEGADSLTKVK